MDNIKITYIFNRNPITKQYFLGCFPVTNLSLIKITRRGFFIVNTSADSNEMGHWLLFFVNDRNSIIFFDSFGFDPKFYGGLIDKFSRLYNHVQIATRTQIQHSQSLLCGSYCIFVAFYLCKGKQIDQILKPFTRRNKRKNDAIVENFTFKMLGLKQTCSKMLCSAISFETFCKKYCLCKGPMR